MSDCPNWASNTDGNVLFWSVIAALCIRAKHFILPCIQFNSRVNTTETLIRSDAMCVSLVCRMVGRLIICHLWNFDEQQIGSCRWAAILELQQDRDILCKT